MTIEIGDLVEMLKAQPRPILCLDTCDLLDSIRGIGLGNLSSLRSLVRVRKELDLRPDCCQVVVTYLVEHEWYQNLESVRVAELAELSKTSERHQLLNEGRSLLGLSSLTFDAVEAAALIDGSIEVAREVIDQAAVLERDRNCIDRALERVMRQQRPSHKNQIKDSIHLEHYLELARRLRSAGFAPPCLFVSANRADFWAGAKLPHIHPDLASDLDAAGLTFFGRLEEAVRRLGI